MENSQYTKFERLDLLPQHLKLITESSISPEVAITRKYRTVTKKAELRCLGFKDYQSQVPALLVPVWGITGEIGLYQSRPDTPRIKNGKALKYETPADSGMILDVNPIARQWIGDPNRPLFVTEGVRKADAAISRGLCCIALLGVWNWRGRNESGGKVALPDWDHIALNERKVYIAFDSDVMEKPPVHQALERLKAFLEQRKARVFLIYLPPCEGGTKVGLDDYLARGHSVDDLLALAIPELRSIPRGHTDEYNTPYESTSDGLVWQKSAGESYSSVRLTNFTAKIVEDVNLDDGVESQRWFEIQATMNGSTTRFRITASQFMSMNWPMEHLGASAIIYPGYTNRDHTRTAIQTLSDSIERRMVYTHTGWKHLNGNWVYLHGDGAISPDGIVESINVSLPDPLTGFVLPPPPEQEFLVQAVETSMKMLDLAPDSTVFPLFALIWRAPIGSGDFSIHLAGSTGAGKSEIAALVQQHWGPTLDSRHLPGSWSSTGNALEGLGFAAKDALVVIDDFAPHGSSADVARLHRDADRVFRGQGNNSGRLRMRADATLKPSKPPRGLFLSTGEDIPQGQSLQARLLALELSPGELDFTRLTPCQTDARNGVYARAMSGYIKWLAGQLDRIRSRLPEEVAELRQAASGSHLHKRTPDLIANLGFGLRLFIEFAEESGVFKTQEAAAFWTRGWKALGETANRQSQTQNAFEPTRQFLELLTAAITSGRAHIADISGGYPLVPEACGWRNVHIGNEDSPTTEYHPMGDCVGWLDGNNLYLEPESAFVTAQRMGRDGGTTLPITSKTLHKRLNEKRLLLSTDLRRNTLTVRRVINGTRIPVLHLKKSSLLPTETDQTDHSDSSEVSGGHNYGHLFGQFTPGLHAKTNQQNRPIPIPTQLDNPIMVSLGSCAPRESQNSVQTPTPHAWAEDNIEEF